MSRFRIVAKALALAVLLGVACAPATAADDSEAIKKKVQALNKITGEDAINEKLLELAKDKDGTKKLLAVAEDMAKLDSKQFNYNSALILASAARRLKSTDTALRFYKLCEKKAKDLKSGKKMGEAFEGQYLVLMEAKKYEQAEELCQKMLEEQLDEDFERTKPFIIEFMVRAKVPQGKVDEALKLTDTLIKLDEGGWYFLRLKGWVLQESGKPDEAVKAYLESIEKLEKNDHLKPEEQERYIDRTKYILSNVYVDLNQIDKAAQELKDLLKKKPDNPTYNNDLGYVWADHDMNLDEAEKLIRKAIEEDRKARKKEKDLLPEDNKDNAAYLDSLGWVLYKKKKFAEAKKELLEAVKDPEGQHIEILDHLGDVHLALGEKADAVKIWKKALDQEMSNRRDMKRREQVIKKVKAAEGK